MNTHTTIQRDITTNGLTMYRLTTLGNMQFNIIQTINQNAMCRQVWLARGFSAV
jgi:hypothetical protein